MPALLDRPGRLGAALALAAVAVLATANYFEHVEGLAPCKLCLYQRVPWWIALGLGSLALLARTRPRVAVAALAVGAVALLANAGLAAYHTGVEYAWWAGPSGCSGDTLPDSFAGMTQALQGAPVARCDEVSWTLFGLSMAAYNVLLSAGAALALLAVLRRSGRHGAAGARQTGGTR